MAKFTKMAYDNADEMVFGHAKKPVSYGCGIKVGAGGKNHGHNAQHKAQSNGGQPCHIERSFFHFHKNHL